MRFGDWLQAERGRVNLVAAHFQVTKSAVSQWVANGVPMDRVVAVRDLTGGAVSIEEMVRARTARREAA